MSHLLIIIIFFFTDINVEHLQLLLFLFHSLPLMQKKSLLLFLAQNIIAVAKIDSRYVLIWSLSQDVYVDSLVNKPCLFHKYKMDTHFLLQQTVWHEPTTLDKDVAGAGVPASLFLWSSCRAPWTGILSQSYSTHRFYFGETSVSLWSGMKFMFRKTGIESNISLM